MKRKSTVREYGMPKQECRATVGGTVPNARDAFPAIDAALGAYRVGETVCLESDGYIGIPVRITRYTRRDAFRTPHAAWMTERIDEEAEPNNYKYAPEHKRLVVYCINTNVERIGTDSDAAILTDLLDRGFHVAVVDYGNELRAKAPDLEWSVQELRYRMDEMGDYMEELPRMKGYSYILPAGYNIKVGIPFFNYHKHGIDGITEFIIDTWNTALHRRSGRFAKGEQYTVYWGEKTDENGVPLRDGNGNPIYKKVTEDAVWTDEEKRLIKVCYTVAEDWWDCVKMNGDPIDMNLYLDLMYPTSPEKRVPVMSCHSSSETRSGAHVIRNRPTMTGYLFRGYAGMTYDHAYMPMARTDHLGYFEGEITKGRRTDFTLRFVAGMEALTAPIRLVRKLAELYPEYGLDGNAIGSYGHSKGAPTNILATAHPELLPKEDYLPGHHGECGKPQPFSFYEDGTPIPSGIQLCYTSNGGGGAYLFPDQCPTVVTQGEVDGPFRSNSHYGSILSTLRSADVPTLDMSMPQVGHTTIYGYSEERDYDMYNALFEFSDYYLKGAPSVCEYILPIDGATEIDPCAKIRLKFTGEHTQEEIARCISVRRDDDTPVKGFFEGHFRGNEWTFTPLDLGGSERVTVSVGEDLTDRRGNQLGRGRTVSFTTAAERTVEITEAVRSEEGLRITFPRPRRTRGERIYLRLAATASQGRIGVYTPDGGRPIATAGVGRGDRFEIDITDRIAGTRKKTLTLILRPMAAKQTRLHRAFLPDESGESPFATLGGKTYPYDDPNSYKPPVTIGKTERVDGCLAFSLPVGLNAYIHDFLPLRSEADLGRTWRIEFDAMSPDGRNVHAKVLCRDNPESPCYMDFYSDSSYLAELRSGVWRHCGFTFSLNDATYLDPDHHKSDFAVMATASQRIEQDRLYLRNLTLTEISGDVTLRHDCLAIVLR